ncbi:MAG: glycosyltransferase family 39 protein [Microcoleaceae cyanobacterium]
MYYSKSSHRTVEVSQWLPIALILGIGTILRLYQLTTESLWIDEMLSIGNAETFQLKFPYLRPFYFVLLKQWMFLGTGDAWLRGFSIIFGLGSIFLTYQLGRRLIDEPTGLLAALLMALSPLFINHSQEIRMYTLISFLSLGGTLALTHVLEHPTYGALAIWVVARIALLLTNSNNVLILLPDTLVLAWTFRQQLRWFLTSGFAMGLIVIAFLPPVWVLTQGGASEDFMAKQVGEYSKPGLTQVLGMITQFTVYWPLRHLFESNQVVLQKDQLGDQSLVANLFASKTLSLIYYGGVTVVLLGLLGIPLFALFRRNLRSEQLVWLCAWAMLPAALMLLISYTQSSIWFPRYLLFVAPYFLILLASGFVVVWRWRRSVGIGIAILYLIAVSGGLKDYYTVLYRNDWQSVAQYLQSNEQPGDSLIYYSVDKVRAQSLPRYYQGTTPMYDLSKSGKTLEKSFIQQELEQMPPVESRLWLVCWVACRDKPGIDRVFEMMVGPGYQVVDLTGQRVSQDGQPVVPTQMFESLEFDPVQVFLVKPGSAGSTKVDSNS